MPEEIQAEQLRYDSRKDGTNLSFAGVIQLVDIGKPASPATSNKFAIANG